MKEELPRDAVPGVPGATGRGSFFVPEDIYDPGRGILPAGIKCLRLRSSQVAGEAGY